MQKNLNLKTNRLVGIAIFTAIIVVLQIVASFIRFGSFSISLVMVPITVGAAVYGVAAGAVFGGAFGLVVLINCINGTDIGGNMLWVANPALTAILCMIKGIAAGFGAGLVYSVISRKNLYAGAMFAAFISRILNTGIFLAAMVLLFRETLNLWADGSNLVYYTFIGLAGVNFLLELGVNIVICPAIVRILNIIKKKA